jgi:flagellar hook assembly protein FlgD
MVTNQTAISYISILDNSKKNHKKKPLLKEAFLLVFITPLQNTNYYQGYLWVQNG